MSKARDLANAGTALTTVSATELGYLDGVTSAVQTQIDSKIGSASAINPTIVDAKGDIVAASAADTVARLAVGANDTVLTADSSTATGLKWAAVAGGYSTYQVFTSSTTWTVPAGITKVAVYAVAGGGGGGSGPMSVGGAVCTGGCGGHGGQFGFDPFYTVTPAASITVTVGAGGAGGAAVTATGGGVDTNGNSGGNGTASVFNVMSVGGGIGGSSGILSTGARSNSANTLDADFLYSKILGTGVGSGGNLVGSSVTDKTIKAVLNTAGSVGNAGGNATAGTGQSAGGSSTIAGFGGGGAGGGGGTGNASASKAGGSSVYGGGGGGGAASSNTAINTIAGAGGAGVANRGAGGGGGGCAIKNGTANTVTSGAGGNGGSGIVVIFY